MDSMKQNKHIEHPEDSILNGDLSVLDWFSTDSTVSVKIDGAPAVVWGTNPANGQFFVGTRTSQNFTSLPMPPGQHQQGLLQVKKPPFFPTKPGIPHLVHKMIIDNITTNVPSLSIAHGMIMAHSMIIAHGMIIAHTMSIAHSMI